MDTASKSSGRLRLLPRNECRFEAEFSDGSVIEPAKGLAGFTPMPHAAMSDTGARCALNKTEGPLSWSQGPHYGTLVGTVTGSRQWMLWAEAKQMAALDTYAAEHKLKLPAT